MVTFLCDYIVGTGQQCERNCEVGERLSGFKIDDEFEIAQRQDRKILSWSRGGAAYTLASINAG